MPSLIGLHMHSTASNGKIARAILWEKIKALGIKMTESNFQVQLDCLMDAGLQGLECYYSRYDCRGVDFLINCANEHGGLISGGSDYHGRKKYPDLGTLNAEMIPMKGKTANSIAGIV